MPYEALEMPIRPPVEYAAAAGWTVAALGTGSSVAVTPLPPGPAAVAGTVMAGLALWRGVQGYQVHRARKRIVGAESDEDHLEFRSWEATQRMIRDAIRRRVVSFGHGFNWTPRETERVYQLEQAKRDNRSLETPKAHWIHELGPTDAPIEVPIKDLEGPTLINGEPGSGKTRLFDLLIQQAVARDDAVVIIDPKGDDDLEDKARKAAREHGKGNRFVKFDPAHPDRSIRIDPMRNFNRATEAAARVSALQASEDTNDPFVAVGWRSVNNVVNGCLLVGEAPTLTRILHYLESGPDDLVARALDVYCRRYGDPDRIRAYLQDEPGAPGLIRYYKEELSHQAASSEVSGLIQMYEYDRQWFGKMIASLMPELAKLTAAPLDELLSPEPHRNEEDPHGRPDIDTGRIVEAGMVAHFRLSALNDPVVSSAIGSMILSDLTAVAGQRYSYGMESDRRVWVFVDEAAEVINQPMIQLLNKGRGAEFISFLATQSLNDFLARLGDQGQAQQTVDNLPNKIILRVANPETQETFSKGLPDVNVRSVETMYQQMVSDSFTDTEMGRLTESVQEAQWKLIPEYLYGKLPKTEFFGIVAGGRVVKGKLPIITDEAA